MSNYSEEEIIKKLESIKVCGDKAELYNFEAGTILNLITKQQKEKQKQDNKIKNVKDRLEYYLMGNLSFNNKAQEEFKKLFKLLEE